MAVFRKDTETQQSTGTIESLLSSILVAINSSNSSGSTAGLNLETTQQAIQACLDLIKSNTDDLSLQSKLLQVDTVGNIVYLGYAEPGTTASSPTWSIKKIVETGGDVDITWADGNNNFDNVWDDRLTLIYS
jgi:hypothetical protein